MINMTDRLQRFYKAVLTINRMMVTVRDEQVLFRELCRVLVDDGNLAMVWIGRVDVESKRVMPVCSYGKGSRFLQEVVISVDDTIPEGRGPTSDAWRTKQPVAVNDYLEVASLQVWREVAQRYGWQSCASFPVLRNGQVSEILGLYHQAPQAFDADTIQLVSALVDTVAFTLDNIDREVTRHDIELELKLAARVYTFGSQAMMVLDEDGLIVSVNKAFESMSGFSSGELHGQKPPMVDSLQKNPLHAQSGGVLAEQSFWQGRMWGKRQNGESYPQWVTINQVPAADEMPSRLVVTVSDITDQVKSEDMIWRQANLDMLTGLPNRFLLNTRMAEYLQRAADRGGIFPLVLFIDIDAFKQINELMGHHVGDILLVEIAGRIRACAGVRSLVTRLGGDEFVVLLMAPSPEGQKELAESTGQCLLAALRQPFDLGDAERSVYVSASIGAAFYPQDGDNGAVLLQKAEQAMYSAKTEGRDRMVLYTSGMQEAAIERVTLQAELRHALLKHELYLQFQPIVSIADGRIVKAEALLRWRNGRRGSVSPVEFIPLAEESGLIVSIGDWVFHAAADWVKRMSQKFGNTFQVSVNMSPVQFKDCQVNVANWLQYLQTNNLATQQVVVEITEGLLMDVGAEVSKKLLDFRNAGIQVALDDFGTGYSSLSYLRRFDIDYLKIDRSFVSGMTRDNADADLVEAIIAMAHKLGLKVVAEGVETATQHAMLQQFGCDFGQGYWYSCAVNEVDFLAFPELFALDKGD